MLLRGTESNLHFEAAFEDASVILPLALKPGTLMAFKALQACHFPVPLRQQETVRPPGKSDTEASLPASLLQHLPVPQPPRVRGCRGKVVKQQLHNCHASMEKIKHHMLLCRQLYSSAFFLMSLYTIKVSHTAAYHVPRCILSTQSRF